MPPPEETTPPQLRRAVQIQLLMTTVFLVVVYALLGGLDADLPPIWLIVVALLVIVAGAVAAERAWLRIAPLPPEVADPERAALETYTSHTLRKMAYTEGALLVCVIIAFASDSAGWLVLIAGVPGLAVVAFETWPSLRNISLVEASLNAGCAQSSLVDQFLES